MKYILAYIEYTPMYMLNCFSPNLCEPMDCSLPGSPVPGTLQARTLAMRETWVQSLGWEDPLEKGKATHSSILAWRIPWTV